MGNLVRIDCGFPRCGVYTRVEGTTELPEGWWRGPYGSPRCSKHPVTPEVGDTTGRKDTSPALPVPEDELTPPSTPARILRRRLMDVEELRTQASYELRVRLSKVQVDGIGLSDDMLNAVMAEIDHEQPFEEGPARSMLLYYIGRGYDFGRASAEREDSPRRARKTPIR